MRKTLLTIGITFFITCILSITATLSVLRTSWDTYRFGLDEWWSTTSTILNVILFIFSIWQYLEAEGQKTRIKSQIKIWMLDAKGIVAALKKVQSLKHTKTSDACNSISMVEVSANAMYQSLYEERVVKEEDYQETEKKKTDIVTEQELLQLKGQASSVKGDDVSRYHFKIRN